MRLFYLLFAFLSITFTVKAQENYEWKEVLSNEQIEVASTMGYYTNSNAKDRVLVNFSLPKGTVGFTFRFTVNENVKKVSLLSALSALPFPEAKAAAAFGNLLSSGDGNNADLYLFTDARNAYAFSNKQEGWRAAKAYFQISRSCRYEADYNEAISFGIRNNNMTTPLTVHLEIVALVDKDKENYLGDEVYHAIYENCMEDENLKEFTTTKQEEYCKCLSNKISNESSLSTEKNKDIIEQKAQELALQCMIDLGLTTKEGLEQEEYTAEIKRLEQQKNFDGIVSYCEGKIKAGVENETLYNGVGWYCLLTKQFTKAKHYLGIGVTKFPLDLFIKGNYAHALLITGEVDKAKQIYAEHAAENITSDLSWKDAVIGDFKQFKERGIECKYFEEILTSLKN